MKKLSLIIAISLFSIVNAIAQTPNLINYQAVVRDNSGEILASAAVSIRISILQNSSTGSSVYSEEHSISTNAFGLVSLQIGAGSSQVGSISNVDWSADDHFFQVELDPDGGSNYTIMGTSQLVSVPYALHAKTVENDQVNDADADATNELQTLTLSGDTLALTQGGMVILPDPPQNLDNDSTNELQLLSLIGNTLNLSNAGSVDLSDFNDSNAIALLETQLALHLDEDQDTSAINELQIITLSSDTAYLSSGGFIYLGGYDNQNAIDALGLELDQDSALLHNTINAHISNDLDTNATNELQAISVSNDTLYLSDGGTVYLGTYLDNTDAQNLTSTSTGTNRTLNISGGTGATISVADNDNDSINEIQSLTSTTSGTNRTINISGSTGTTISVADNDNSSTNEIQTISKSGNTVTLSNGGGSFTDAVDDADADASNEIQTISKSGNTVTLSNSGGSFTDAIDDADADASNELQTISKSGNTVTLSNGGGSYTDAVDDADASATNEIQNLSFSGTTVTISSGNSINLASLQDGTGSDDQTLSISNDTLYIEDGNGIYLGSGDSDWDSTGANIYRMTGNVGIGTNNPGTKLEVAGHISQTGTGESIFIGEGAGDSDDLTTNRNVFIGNDAGQDNTTGYNNAFIGHFAGRNNTTGRDNTVVGRYAFQSNLSGWNNTAIGSSALSANTANDNTAVGLSAMSGNTTGTLNVAMGISAIGGANTGDQNTAIGNYALRNNTWGENNTSIGFRSLYDNTTGAKNVAVGQDALYSNTSGSVNTAVGERALRNNTSGTQNTAMGEQALLNMTTSSSNSAFGSQALRDATGFTNTAIGSVALMKNSSGNYNVAIGGGAGFNNISGSGNVFLGREAGLDELGSNKLYIENSDSPNPLVYGDFANDTLRVNGTLDVNKAYVFPTTDGTTGQVLTTDGSGALSWNDVSGGDSDWDSTGSNIHRVTGNVGIGTNTPATKLHVDGNFRVGNPSTSLGGGQWIHNMEIRATNGYPIYRMMYQGYDGGRWANQYLAGSGPSSNTIGSGFNTAIGGYALRFLTTGSNNVALGWAALYNNTTGGLNVALGSQSVLRSNTTGSQNIGIGHNALRNNIGGNQNTAIGINAFINGTSYSNSTAIGYQTAISASNQIRLGNASVTSIGGQVGWTTISDARFKKNVQEDVVGLDLILALRPVTYSMDMDAMANFFQIDSDDRNSELEAGRASMKQSGFIAQEVAAAAKELGYEFSGIDAPKNTNDHYGLRYSEFVVPMVKAIQEQQETIETLLIEIEFLKSQLD